MGPNRQFTWMATGQPFGYTFWHDKQPDFFRKIEFCLQIGGASIKWNDHKCAARFGYICENRTMTREKEEKKEEEEEKEGQTSNMAILCCIFIIEMEFITGQWPKTI